MSHRQSAQEHFGRESAEYADEAFCDVSDDPSPACCGVCDEPLDDAKLELAGSRSLQFPAAHRCST